MTRTWFSLGLCLVLLIPEPATYALLVIAAACLVLSPLTNLWDSLARQRVLVEGSGESIEVSGRLEGTR